MAVPNKNLKAAFEYLGLTNLAVSKALNLDPSLISRYLSGHRQLKAASPQMDAIADFILGGGRCVQDIQWLSQQFTAAGLPTERSTVNRLKQNLILWLATDGDTLRRNLGASLPGLISATAPLGKKDERKTAFASDGIFIPL